mgnify:CR=1 FL=1|tara:strand:+ start:448 stop:861 length:414 start_codon:yes stop_codon:yes gene_type:complete
MTRIENEVYQSASLEIANDFLERFKENQYEDFNKCVSDVNELHHDYFNQDYYIIGYYNAKKWLEKHNIDVFEALTYCNESEMEYFGEINTKLDNYEILVNNFVYWLSLEVLIQVLKINETMTIRDVLNIQISEILNK